MNILFIVPNFPKKISDYLILPSLELCTMSSVLKKENHNVNLIDMRIDDLVVDDLDCILKKFNPNLICIEGKFEDHCNVIEIIKKCKKLHSKTPLCLRGEIASFLPDETLHRNPDLDFVLRFENEFTIKDLIKELNSLNPDFSSINNIAFRKGSIIKVTPVAPPIKNIDSLPYPDRELYDMKKYLNRDSETIVRSSRGCPGNCSFCVKTKLSPFRVFSVERFCDEIELLQDYGFESFFFSDDTFAFSDKRVEEFCNEVNRRNLKIKWTSNIRVKDINNFKISNMKKAGAYRVFVGLETINSNSSKLVNKNLNAKEIIDKINILKKYNMQFHASFILGSPGDTEEDLENLINFLDVINPTLVTFNKIKPLPGTDLQINSNKYDLIIEDKFWYEKDEWTTRAVTGTKLLPPERIDYWSNRLFNHFMNIKFK